MPTRPTDTPEWASDANFPAGGDPWSGTPTRVEPDPTELGTGNVPETRPPAQHHNWIKGLLADWVAYFAAIIDANEEHTYQTPKARIIVVPFLVPEHNAGGTLRWSYNDLFQAGGLLDTSTGAIDIGRRMPNGAVLTRVDALVLPAAARATQANRMRLQVLKRTIDWTTPSIPADTQVGSDAFDDGNAALQVITLSGLSETVSSEEEIRAHIRVGTTTAGDDVYALRIHFNDPGPRNY